MIGRRKKDGNKVRKQESKKARTRQFCKKTERYKRKKFFCRKKRPYRKMDQNLNGCRGKLKQTRKVRTNKRKK